MKQRARERSEEQRNESKQRQTKRIHTSSWPSASMASELFALPRVDLRALGIVVVLNNNDCVCLFVWEERKKQRMMYAMHERTLST